MFVSVDDTVCGDGLGLGRSVSKERMHTHTKANLVQFGMIINVSATDALCMYVCILFLWQMVKKIVMETHDIWNEPQTCAVL